jgi:hypothetical protein
VYMHIVVVRHVDAKLNSEVHLGLSKLKQGAIELFQSLDENSIFNRCRKLIPELTKERSDKQ